MPLIQSINVGPITIPAGATLPIFPSWAGAAFTVSGGDANVAVVGYLYGPGRKNPKSAKLDGLRFPDVLPEGEYLLKLQRQGEGDTTYAQFILQMIAPTTASISGTLFNDNDADGVMNGNDTFTGIRNVVLIAPDGTHSLTPSNAAGQFRFEGLTPGVYKLGRESFPGGYRMSNKGNTLNGNLLVTIAGTEQLVINIGTTGLVVDSSLTPADPGDIAGTPVKPPVVPPVVVPTTPATPTLRKHLIKGTVSGGDIEPNATILRADGKTKIRYSDLVKEWGTQADRIWLSLTASGKVDTAKVDKAVAWCKACGVSTLFVLVTPDTKTKYVPTAAVTTAYMKALVAALAKHDIKFIVELANEPNLRDYWNGTSLKQLVDVFINPACAVLHAAGIETCGGSVTYSVASVQALHAAGMMTRSQGFHPYRENAADLKKLMAQLALVTGAQPVDLTEWAAFLGKYLRAWQVLAAHPQIATNAKIAGRAIINADLQKFDPLAELPAKSPDAIVTNMLAQWAVLLACPTVRYVLYYAVIVGKETATGPEALIRKGSDGVYREQKFSSDFWCKAAA